jgi:hypothetical protein
MDYVDRRFQVDIAGRRMTFSCDSFFPWSGFGEEEGWLMTMDDDGKVTQRMTKTRNVDDGDVFQAMVMATMKARFWNGSSSL